MRVFILLIGFLSLSIYSHAQTYEVGGFLGGANYVGDVGNTQYINPNKFVVGGLFKWNRSPRHSFRASVNYAKITGDDAEGDPRRKKRDYSFKNTIKELNLGLEFTFWDYNTHEDKFIHTPYLYTGVTYFMYKNLYYKEDISVKNDKIARKDGNKSSFAIPIVLGYKAYLGRGVSLGFEIGARYTFTDNLDGSNPGGAGEENYRFGNQNSKDWYVFSGITLTFAFGRIPCSSNF